MILLNDFKRQWADTGDDVLAAVQEVGESGWYILGRQVAEFERELEGIWGMPHAVGVASGLDAIEIGLRVLGCKSGDYVLTSPISAFATALAILRLDATPVFADCDAHGLIDLDECKAVLERRPEIRFFVPVHLYGHSLDAGELRSLRDRFELNIVEDCAQAILATSGAQPVGTTGQIAATSFYPTKNLGALGDGGAILTHTQEHADAAREFRDYGQSSKYRHDVVGYNSRLDELHAGILRKAFLPKLQDWTEARRRCAAAYNAGIESRAIAVPGAVRNSCSSWHLFPALVDAARKQAAIEHFKSRGILVSEHYPLAIVEQKALAWRDEMGSPCPRSIEFCRREISLPIHPYLTADEIAQVIQACNDWVT